MDDKKKSLLTRAFDSSADMPFKQRLFNFYYRTLRKKSISLLLLTFFMIFETVELVSYAFIDQYRELWKVKKSSMDMIQLVLGVTRVTPLMKYLSFNYYFIVFVVLICFIFLNFLLLAMTLSINKTDSKLYAVSVTFTSYVTSNVCVFFLVPVSEVILLIVKCDDNNKVDIVKDSVECFQGLHILYVMLAVFAIILFLCLIIMNAIFNFNPFNANNPTTIINPTADTFLVIFKIILVILYVAIYNQWISIVILILGSLLNLKNALENPTYNSYFLQCMVSMRNGTVFWTFIILFVSKLVSSTNFNGMIYLLSIGYPLIFLTSALYYRYLRQQFCEGKSNFKNVSEFLMRVNYLKILIDAFINKNVSNKGGNSFNTLKKKEILLRGQIKIHEESCTNEECPLKKFLENQGNYQVQKTSLLHYMNIIFNEAIKKFPESQIIQMAFVQFNFDKKYNLNSAKMYLSKLERFQNNLTEEYILFFIKTSVNVISSKYGEEEMIKVEDTPEHKFKRFKLLIENATKLYGEFWGNLSTNLTNNLNLNKLFFVGNRLNSFLHELNVLWEDFKTKKIDMEHQSILQLYCLFLRDIMKNKIKSEEISKKLNEDQGYEAHKTEGDKIDLNNLDSILESQDFVLYCRSNDVGSCSIIQISNSIISLLGYQKNELIGKKIEMLMPMLCQGEHSKMLGSRLKNIRNSSNMNQSNKLKLKEKKQIFLLIKNKVGYLTAINARFSIYNDDDFSNTFIIKTKIEQKDPKVVYAYYVMTKSDFTVDSISSSAINLGLTMDLLKKHLINLNNLVRSEQNEAINICEHVAELEEEQQVVTWVFPELVYPKTDINNNTAEIDMEKLVSESRKKKMNLSITSFKFYESEPFGFCFKFTECEGSNCGNSGNGIRNQNGFDPNGFSEFSQKLMLYDVIKMNYIRAEIVQEKAKSTLDLGNNSNSCETHKDLNSTREMSTKKETETDLNKSTPNQQETTSDKSESEDTALINPLSRERIQEFQVKGSEEIKIFIKSLPFFGKDIFLKKKLPNKDENNVGYGIEPNIKINLDDFIERIDRAKLIDKRQIIQKEAAAAQEVSPETLIGTTDINSVSSSTQSLNNLFTRHSIVSIKITALVYVCVIAVLLCLDFSVSFLQIKEIHDRMYYSEQAFDILSYLLYTKFFVTEAIQSSDENYVIFDDYYNNDHTAYINDMMTELSDYRKKITDSLSMFNNATVTFGDKYQNIINNVQINIMTLTNGLPTTEFQPFWTAINRIPTSIFYVSTVTDNSSTVGMHDRNVYELMMNLLNEYYIYWKELTLVLSEEIQANTGIKAILVGAFVFSFICTFLFSGLSFHFIQKFLVDGTRPVDLLMTIKKSKFEDLKVNCEGFLNKLVNKFFGNEEADDDNQPDFNISVNSDDIVISKFKQKNLYNQSITSNKQFLIIFICLILTFIFFQVYFLFKYNYQRLVLDKIKNFSTVHNITLYSESDLILSYDVAKSFFFDQSTPILNTTSSIVFENSLTNLSDSIEELIKITYSNMDYLSKNYITFFYEKMNEDITSIANRNYTKTDFKGSMQYGFKPLVLRYFELIRYLGLDYFQNNPTANYSNTVDYSEAGVMLRHIIRPWYQAIKEKIENFFHSYVDSVNLIITTIFIVFLVVIIFLYLLVWKSIEEKLGRYLNSSIDLINLIPEEMKYQMILKLNEEEQRENKN